MTWDDPKGHDQMTDTTPALGLPYPEGTDRVTDGYAAIQALAEAVETVITAMVRQVAPVVAYDSGSAMQIIVLGFAIDAGDAVTVYSVDSFSNLVPRTHLVNAISASGTIYFPNGTFTIGQSLRVVVVSDS